MRSLLFALILPFPFAAHAQLRVPATTLVAMAELKDLAKTHADAASLTAATQGYYPTALLNGRCMIGFLCITNDTFDPEAAQNEAVRFGARIGQVLSMRIDATQLDVLYTIPGLTYAELAGKVAPDLDKVLRATRVDSVHAGINLPQAYAGNNVLIGITDWGFDYTHPMFYDTSLTATRIRAAWDQYRQAGPAPAGFNYGTELSTVADLMQAGSDTANIYSYHTHGTHVAGITGGSGAGTNYRGIAFQSQFLFTSFLVDAAAVLDAFAWMRSIAEQDQKRLVVNMSWGLYHMGTLDGTSLISQAIDQLTDEGVVFVTSGGNNGNVNFHIRKDFASDTLHSRIQFYSYSANPNMWGQSISMWGQAGQSFSAGFDITNGSNQVLRSTPWYNTATQPAYLDSFIVQGTDTVFFNITADAAHPLNGRPHFRLRVKNTSSQLFVALKATAPNGTVHFWNVTELTNDVGNWGQAFQAPVSGWTAGNTLYGIGEPACTASAISVAAYSSETYLPNGNVSGGAIAAFSSTGPTLDERVKPDIAAPGVNVASSISSFTDAAYTPTTSISFQGRTYPFARYSGTSMSSPAVAGIAALCLEADPELTPAELKALLMSTARTDNQTGAIPPGGSTRWGSGKVNAYRAVLEALGVVGITSTTDDQLLVWPVPTNDVVHVRLPEGMSQAHLTLTDVTGRVVREMNVVTTGQVTLSMQDLSPGAYLLRLEYNGTSHVVRVVRR
jgi:subtilisin family serine protease